MNISKKHLKQLALIDLILGEVPFTIAGGFPRDIFFGVTPKDIDVWITYSNENFREVKNALDEFAITYKDFPQYGDEDGGRGIKGMLQSETAGIDFIFVERDHSEMWKDFDFNFNQFVFLHGTPVYKGETPVTELRQIKEDLSSARVEKIVKKFRNVFGKDAKCHFLEEDDTITDARDTDEYPEGFEDPRLTGFLEITKGLGPAIVRISKN